MTLESQLVGGRREDSGAENRVHVFAYQDAGQ
jgi:hypothetical protein